MGLPTAKTPPTLAPETAKVLLYGPGKFGKSTLASQIDPEHTLFLATEAGLGGLEVFAQPIGSWEDFRKAGAELAERKHPFTTLVIDTIDVLHKMCSDFVCASLGIKHPSDLEYGKGWAAVNDEFQLRIGKLCALGYGVWFISHSTQKEIKSRVGSITKTTWTISGKSGEWLEGFVDYILLGAFIQGDDDQDVRVLRTKATETYEAGGRRPLPDPLPLDAEALRKAMADACKPAGAAKPEAKPDKAAAPKERAKAGATS